jgi:hypothetical protein
MSGEKMSTRNNIGILNRDGTVEIIYCHYDGYPRNNGTILLTYYYKEKTVRELIINGNLVSLANTIATCNRLSFGGSEKKNSIDFDINFNIEFIYLFDISTNSWIYKKAGEEYSKLTTELCR